MDDVGMRIQVPQTSNPLRQRTIKNEKEATHLYSDQRERTRVVETASFVRWTSLMAIRDERDRSPFGRHFHTDPWCTLPFSSSRYGGNERQTQFPNPTSSRNYPAKHQFRSSSIPRSLT